MKNTTSSLLRKRPLARKSTSNPENRLLSSEKLVSKLAWEYTRHIALGEEVPMERFLSQLTTAKARQDFKLTVHMHELLKALGPLLG